MAKKKKKAKKKSDALLLPKRIAGVKIPKPLRRQGRHLADLARHPLVADVVAAGIVALAASVRDKETRNRRDTGPEAAGEDTPSVPPEPAGAEPAVAAEAPAPSAAPKPRRQAAADGKAASPPRTRRKAAPRTPTTPKTTH